MNKTFKASVSANMIEKSSRMFNASIKQIVGEILQNSKNFQFHLHGTYHAQIHC